LFWYFYLRDAAAAAGADAYHMQAVLLLLLLLLLEYCHMLWVVHKTCYDPWQLLQLMLISCAVAGAHRESPQRRRLQLQLGPT
jgi:hypothetical protein